MKPDLDDYMSQLVEKTIRELVREQNLLSRYGIEPDFANPGFDTTPFKVVIESSQEEAVDFARKVTKENIEDQWKRIVLFSDGSIQTGLQDRLCGTGIAYKICHGRHSDWEYSSAAILGACSNNMAELTGINIALDIAACEMETEKMNHSAASTAVEDDISGTKRSEPKHDGNSKIYIMADAQAVLDYINRYFLKRIKLTHDRVARWISHPAWKELLRQLERISQLDTQVEFHWVKGHAKVRGNILADALARRATNRYRKEYRTPRSTEEYQVVRLPREMTSNFIATKQSRKRKAGRDSIVDPNTKKESVDSEKEEDRAPRKKPRLG